MDQDKMSNIRALLPALTRAIALSDKYGAYRVIEKIAAITRPEGQKPLFTSPRRIA